MEQRAAEETRRQRALLRHLRDAEVVRRERADNYRRYLATAEQGHEPAEERSAELESATPETTRNPETDRGRSGQRPIEGGPRSEAPAVAARLRRQAERSGQSGPASPPARRRQRPLGRGGADLGGPGDGSEWRQRQRRQPPPLMVAHQHLQAQFEVADDEPDPAVWSALRQVAQREVERPRKPRYTAAMEEGRCWSCGQAGHRYSACPRTLQHFCRRCGEPGRRPTNCPRCRKE